MSILNVNQIQPVGSGQTITISASDITASSATITASKITASSGDFTVGTGSSVYSPATNTLALGTNSAERVRITSDGDVGIGDNAPNNNYGTNLSIHSTATDGARLKLSDGSTGKGNLDGLDIISTGSQAYFIQRENGAMLFYTNNTEAARFTAAGNLAFPSGQGIDFSATSDGSGTVTAETLSEYEEGTWTPVLASLTGGTQPVVTTSAANGIYTRIGRMVYIEFLMIVTAVTTQGTGNIGVTGLPFTTSGLAYGNNIGITYNDIWDTAWREMYVTGSSLQMIPLGVTQSNAYYGTPANDSQSQISTGYFSAAGWYLRS